MSRVLCTLDHRPAAAEAVREAIERCCDRGAELALVGVVEPFSEPAGPAYGERVRRLGLVEINLVRAGRTARAAGLDPTSERRFGRLRSEAVTAADEVGADEIVLTEPRGLLRRGDEIVVIDRPRPAPAGPRRLRLVA